MDDTKKSWKRVTKSHPCTICGKSSYCSYTADAAMMNCTKVASDKPNKAGNGWLHFADGGKADRKRNDTPSGTDWKPERERRKTTPPKTTPTDRPGEANASASGTKTTWPTEDEAIKAMVAAKGGTLASTYRYFDEAGDKHLFTRIRIDLPDGGKTYCPLRPYKGRWKIGNPAKRNLPIYRLADVRAEPVVYVTEGEKAADAGWRIGLPCVTSADGADNAAKTDWTPLAGRDMVIVPDNDEAGEKYAADVARLLLNLSPPARVRIVRLPGLEDGEDLFDWLAERPDTAHADLIAEIERLTDAAAAVEPADVGEAIVELNLADVRVERIRFLWEGRFAYGTLSLLAGEPGAGKSTLAMYIAAVVTTGGTFPDAPDHRVERGTVILLSAEDDPATVVAPRLQFAGADLSKVVLLTAISTPKADGKRRERMVTLADIDQIEKSLDRHPDTKLLIIDPVGDVVGKADGNSDSEMRGLLGELRRVVKARGIACLLVAHTNKRAGAPALHRVMGSTAFTGIVRNAWVVLKDPQDDSRRLLVLLKANTGRRDGLAFTEEKDPASPYIGKVVIDPTPITLSADEIMAAEAGGQGEDGDGEATAERTTRFAEAISFLRVELADGPVLARDVKRAASDAGHSWTTVKAAKDKAGVMTYKEAGRADGPWWWKLRPVEPLPEDNPGESKGLKYDTDDPHT
jgi:hypothetical protein